MEITHFRKNSKDETKLRNKINLIYDKNQNKSTDCINNNRKKNMFEKKKTHKNNNQKKNSKEKKYEKNSLFDLKKDFLETKNSPTKKKDNLISFKKEKYITNGISNNNNIKNNELCIENNFNSNSRRLLNLYCADEDYFNHYYYDELYIKNKNENNNIDSNNYYLDNKENNSTSSQEIKSFSSKSNGLYSKKTGIEKPKVFDLNKKSKVKINTEIDILKYNRNEKYISSATKSDENKNKNILNNKSKKKQKNKDKGILKNKNGRSRTLLLKSNLESIKKELNFKDDDDKNYKENSTEEDIKNNLDLKTDDILNNRSDMFFNNDFNKEKIKQMLENKIIKNENRMKNINKNENQKTKKKKKKIDIDENVDMDYEIDYSKHFKEKNKIIKKMTNDSESKKLNKSTDAVIYF